MPLQSNAKTSSSGYTWEHGDTITGGSHFSRYQTFIVNPSPCINPENFKLPGEYNYSIEVVQNPRGYVKGYYYWGNPGNRHRTKHEYNGVFSNAVWDQFSNGLLYGDIYTVELNKLSARNRAINKLLDKIKDSEVNLGTTLGEGRETLHMVAAIARSVQAPLKALRSAVHKSRKKESRVSKTTRDTLTTVGSLQLAWSVGLAPLLSDCENLRKHTQAAEELDIRYSAKSRASSHTEWSTSHKDGSQFANGVSTRHQFGAEYRVGDLHAFENWRLGLTARPTLAWELLTLSWVVDYFLQIGNYLAALEASYLNNGITLISAYETKVVWKLSSYELTHAEPSNADAGALNGLADYHLGLVHGKGYRQWTTKSRSRLTSLPTHAFPTIKLPTASTQLLNCAALLSMLLKR